MNRAQYLKIIAELGLSQVGAGRMLGVSKRQAQRFASGESPIPEPVARLLWLMDHLDLTEDNLTKVVERRFT